MPRIAAAAYPLSALADWAAYEAKLSAWVGDAASAGAEILVFPEYGGAELASFGGANWGKDHFGAVDAITGRLEKAERVLAKLAAKHEVFILSGSAPIRDGDRILNRTALIGPEGGVGVQDKMIPTRWEREALGMVGGDAFRIFETPLGKLGVALCYDAEFPLIARALAEAGAEILLAPACTETFAGHSRVKIGAMARALENQFWVAHAPLVGANEWAEMVDDNTGAAAIYGPPDHGFPPDGIAAEGALDAPGWIFADCDPGAVQKVRRDGGVLNHANWSEQDDRLRQVNAVELR